MREGAARDARPGASRSRPGNRPAHRTISAVSLAQRLALFAAFLVCALTLTVLTSTQTDSSPVLFARVGVLSSPTLKSNPTPTRTPNRSPTRTPTPTDTVTSGNVGTLMLSSPASAQGPVGANLTFAGDSWQTHPAGQEVSLSATATTCSSSGITSLGQAQIGSDGSFSATVVWPNDLAATGTAYALCATLDGSDFATAPQSYRVRSAQPPALALSLPTVGVGQETQIGGANFVGTDSVQLTLTTPQGSRTLATATPDPKDGSFTLTYIPTTQDLGSASLSAASAPDGDAPPALQASVQFQIVAAPTAATASQATPSATHAPTATSASSSSLSMADAVFLAVGSLLFVLLLIGAVAWIFLMPLRTRRRPKIAARPGSDWAHISYRGSNPTGSEVDLAPRYPSDESVRSDSYPTFYPHDAPTVGPGSDWSAPSQVGAFPHVAPRTPSSFPNASAARPSRVRRDTWAAPQTARHRAPRSTPGYQGLPPLESNPGQANASDTTIYDGDPQ